MTHNALGGRHSRCVNQWIWELLRLRSVQAIGNKQERRLASVRLDMFYETAGIKGGGPKLVLHHVIGRDNSVLSALHVSVMWLVIVCEITAVFDAVAWNALLLGIIIVLTLTVCSD